MPALKNIKHEQFAQMLVEGQKRGWSRGACYSRAGYTAEGHAADVAASRLMTNAENGIAARVQEITLRGAMSDIFISFEKSDLPRAEMLAHALAEHGWSVFWDRTIAIGSTWRQTIGQELDGARAVVVLWSKSSVASNWVLDEADDARGRGILIPILIQNISPPMGFRSIQTGSLIDWDGAKTAKPFQKLVADLNKLLGQPRGEELAIRDFIENVTSKAVLILGRFTDDRKPILDAVREELRKRNYLPILFDFEKPRGRDTDETIRLLAGMAKFVIADVSDAKAVLQELRGIVPDLPLVPVQPIILATQEEPGMFDFYRNRPSFLPLYRYADQEQLLADLGDKVIRPAELKVQELRG